MKCTAGKTTDTEVITAKSREPAAVNLRRIKVNEWEAAEMDEADEVEDWEEDLDAMNRFFDEREEAYLKKYGPGWGLRPDKKYYTPDELRRKLAQSIKEWTAAEINAGRLPPQPKDFWDKLERDIND